MTDNIHYFLTTADGRLSLGAKAVPAVREHIGSMPATASTFKSKDIDLNGHPSSLNNYNLGNVRTVHYEFVGAWPLPERYQMGSGTKRTIYVNPRGAHARHYTDVVSRCECGAIINRWYDDGALDDATVGHSERCKPYHELRARAGLYQHRHLLATRLVKMGWQAKDIARRFGMSSDAIGPLLQEFDTSLSEIRGEYRAMAAATYVYLTRDNDVPAEDVAEVYDHDVSTLGRWVRKYLNYETMSGKEFVRDPDNGGFRWLDVDTDPYPWRAVGSGISD